MTAADLCKSLWWRALASLHIPGRAIRIESETETLHAIARSRASIARFGDGELMVMLGYGIYFQEYMPVLSRRLREIVRQPGERFYVGLPPFDSMSITKAKWRKAWARYRRLFSYLVRGGAVYHSTAISRPASVGNFEPEEYYRLFASLWEDRELVLVHNSREVVNHPMFRNARRVSHVACPPEHAFRSYDDLLAKTSAFLATPGVLFLIAAGPAACVLAWDLAQLGGQALDVGHLTSAYDEYVRKS